MSNILNNTTGLQEILEALQTKAAGSGGIDTSDATATADEIFAGETAYANGQKITGTFTIDNELTEQNDLISQISTLVAQKANPQGGTDTSDATATANDILNGKTAYAKGSKITGAIPSKAATTYTPGTSNQIIASGTYLSGTQTIKGDSNLTAGNIKSGVSIFGVAGTYEGSGSSGGSTDTCNVIVNSDYIISGIGYATPYGGEIWNRATQKATFTALCDSELFIIQDGYDNSTITNGTMVNFSWGEGLVVRTTSTPGATVMINITTD